MNERNTVDALKRLESRIYALGDTLLSISRRIDDLLDRPIEWSREYLRTVLAETAEMARCAVQEDEDHE